EMLAEYLAVAIRNSRLYTEIATTKRSLEQLIASAGDAIIPVGGDDRVEGWNPAAERIFGLSASDALGRAITTLLPAADYADAKRRLSGGTPMHAFEVSVPRGSGRPAALAVTLSALGDPQGAVTGLIAIVRDITAQREIEGQLNQAEKLTALGQLAGGIAHDFNNLLQAILGYSQLMKQNIGDADLVTRSLQVLESVAMDGSETVRRIQQFARLRPDEEFVPVDVNKIVHDAVAIIRPRWEEKLAQENRQLDLRLDLGAPAQAPPAPRPGRRGVYRPSFGAPPAGRRGGAAPGGPPAAAAPTTPSSSGATRASACRRPSAGASSSRSSPPRAREAPASA